MAQVLHFSHTEKDCINRTFGHAEELMKQYFRLAPADWKSHRYDVKTRAHLNKHEVNNRAFAQLCKYYYAKDEDEENPENFHFYRICLQDDRILNAVERGHSFIKLRPLMLYIATHELVHVVRFNNGDSEFEAPMEEKIKEEEKVHSITKNILQPLSDPKLNLVLDCFDDRYHIGDIFN